MGQVIYGPDGRPVELERVEQSLEQSSNRAKLFRFKAPDDWQDSVAAGVTPERLGSILNAAVDDDPVPYLSYAEELEERDGHYAGQLSVRKNAVLGVEFSAVGGEERVRAEVSAMLDDLLQDAAGALLDSLGKGYAVAQLGWAHGPKMWSIDSVEWVDPKWFRWPKGQIAIVDPEDDKKTRLLPAYQFAVHLPGLKNGRPIRNGLARRCAFYHLAKAVALRDWVTLGEVYGMPIPLGRYPEGYSEDQQFQLLKLLSNIRSRGGGAVPSSVAVELLTPSGAANGDVMFGGLIREMNREMSKAILGQVGTADGGQGNSKQTEMGKVRQDILEADAERLARVISRDIITPFVHLNFGFEVEVPRLVPGISRVQDLGEFASAVETLRKAGLPISIDSIYEHLPFRRPLEGETLLSVSDSENIGKDSNDNRTSSSDE